VPHLKRAPFPSRHPVHVTLRVQPGVGYLRAGRRAKTLQASFHAARERFGMRIAHYSIQGNHLHLIVESEGAPSLSRAMQGLCIRLAKRLNALATRKGAVFADRYHAQVLSSRRQVANAVRYVLRNYRHHAREWLPSGWRDPLSSAAFVAVTPPDDAPVAAPRTWLLRIGWKLASPVTQRR
jgi:putative transposase